jgi:hypothetical protein
MGSVRELTSKKLKFFTDIDYDRHNKMLKFARQLGFKRQRKLGDADTVHIALQL